MNNQRTKLFFVLLPFLAVEHVEAKLPGRGSTIPFNVFVNEYVDDFALVKLPPPFENNENLLTDSRSFQRVVTGTVLNDSCFPLAGVQVPIKETNNGVQTDAKRHYRLTHTAPKNKH